MPGACSLCRRVSVEPLLELGAHPIGHQLLDAPADVYLHPMQLGLCESCAFLQLIDPIPAERLYTRYNWLSAWKWNPHVPRLLELIGDLPGIDRSSRVLEVGSNDGSFLAELRDAGFSNLIGVEPAGDAAAGAAARGVETVNEYFTPQLARRLHDCDLLVAREVLEHIADLHAFGNAMQQVLRPGARVLVEVPDFGVMMAAPDYSVLWEEHTNYFTRETLIDYLGDNGIAVSHIETVTFSGYTLIALGEYTGERARTGIGVETARAAARRYANAWPSFREDLVGYLADARRDGRRIAMYGGGVRAGCLVNYASLAPYIDFVVDDEPAKQGKFMPESGLAIEASDALVTRGADLCLLAVNAENEVRVIARHESFAAAGGEFVSLHPPSPRLPPFWLDHAAGTTAGVR